MPNEVGNLNAVEIRHILKRITGQDFVYSSDKPDDAVFALRDHNITQIESLCLEWAVKSYAGILLISEPVTRRSFWNLPEDVEFGQMAMEDALNELQDQYNQFLQAIAQSVYVANGKYGTNIKVEGESEPRLIVFLNNHQSEEKLIATVAAMENLLPKLQMSA